MGNRDAAVEGDGSTPWGVVALRLIELMMGLPLMLELEPRVGEVTHLEFEFGLVGVVGVVGVVGTLEAVVAVVVAVGLALAASALALSSFCSFFFLAWWRTPYI